MRQDQSEQHKLLLIDDDFNLVFLTKDYLEFRGYSVTTAENGVQGIESLQHDRPDLIICDVMMPEMNGYSFVEQVRSNPQTQDIPILFLSAKGQNKDRLEGLRVGADRYIVKPFEPEELLSQIETLLQSR